MARRRWYDANTILTCCWRDVWSFCDEPSHRFRIELLARRRRPIELSGRQSGEYRHRPRAHRPGRDRRGQNAILDQKRFSRRKVGQDGSVFDDVKGGVAVEMLPRPEYDTKRHHRVMERFRKNEVFTFIVHRPGIAAITENTDPGKAFAPVTPRAAEVSNIPAE